MKWRYKDADLHYSSVGDYYRRNIHSWWWGAWYSLWCVGWWIFTPGPSWLGAFWVGMIALGTITFFLPCFTYYKVIRKHMAHDRTFLAALEKEGVPPGIAQQMLNALEDPTLAPGQCLEKYLQLRMTWHRFGELPPEG